MFSENTIKSGCIEVICGSMFSGKTEELIRRLKRAQFANQKIAIFKPTIDNRYSDVDVVSHDLHSITSTPVDAPVKMLGIADDVQVVGVDEAQFFDDSIVEVVQTLANRGVRVIIAGLDTDFLGKPHGHRRGRPEGPRHLRQVRRAGQPLAPPLGEHQARGARREGRVRAPLPPVLQRRTRGRAQITISKSFS